VDEYEVVIGQKEGLASLTMHEILHSAPELKVAIVSDDFKGLG
jgi:hypothetical protein